MNSIIGQNVDQKQHSLCKQREIQNIFSLKKSLFFKYGFVWKYPSKDYPFWKLNDTEVKDFDKPLLVNKENFKKAYEMHEIPYNLAHLYEFGITLYSVDL